MCSALVCFTYFDLVVPHQQESAQRCASGESHQLEGCLCTISSSSTLSRWLAPELVGTRQDMAQSWVVHRLASCASCTEHRICLALVLLRHNTMSPAALLVALPFTTCHPVENECHSVCSSPLKGQVAHAACICMQVWLDGARAATQMDRPDRPLRCLLVRACQPASGSVSVVRGRYSCPRQAAGGLPRPCTLRQRGSGSSFQPAAADRCFTARPK